MSFLLPVARDIPGLLQKSWASCLSWLEILYLHNTIIHCFYPQKICIGIVRDFPWDIFMPQTCNACNILGHLLDIFQINSLDIAEFMFRYHNNLLPPLFLNLFMTNSQVHTYDTRTAGNCRMHSCRTNIKKFTILYQGPRIWNCLPASITNLSSFCTFKNEVLEFLLE